MTTEISIPCEVPVMTLSTAVLFPHAIMPLYIFEPRYRQMLEEVLQGERVFAVAAADESVPVGYGEDAPACAVAGVGMIRACTKNPDGTSRLVLQGLARVRVESIVTESPYRLARIEPLLSEQNMTAAQLKLRSQTLLALLESQDRLGAEMPDGMVAFLKSLNDPESILDIAISSLCADPALRQRLLETTGLSERFAIFEHTLRETIAELRLQRKLKGGLDDDSIGFN